MSGGNTILMMFDNVSDDYVARITEGGQDAARSSGRQFRAINLYNSPSKAEDLLADPAVGGVILTPPLADDRRVLSQVEARRIPMARIGAMLDLDRGCTVVMDEYDAARAVTSVLLEAGHRRIGFIKGPREHLVSMRRQNGFANALGGKGLRLEPSLCDQGDFSRASGEAAALRLLTARPTAIFASNDEMALGVIDAAKRKGIAIPGDISLVGFDDNQAARTSSPPLTTVRQPLRDMGRVACRLVIERLDTPGKASAHEVVPFEVMRRQSVADILPDRLSA